MTIFETTRKMLASSRQLFNAFEDPALLNQWWGPDGFSTTSDSFEFRPNGIWTFVMHGPDGKNYPNEMIFQEIVAPNKVVLRHNVPPYFTLTVTINDSDEGAIIHWHQNFDDANVAQQIAHMVQPANEQNLDKLQALVVSG